MLQLAMENEVDEYVGKHSSKVDSNGKRIVVKNGLGEKKYFLLICRQDQKKPFYGGKQRFYR